MEFQGKHEHDALDQILKRYLLERDAATPDGEGLMEMAAESVFAATPTVSPTAAKEAEMLARLQADFPSPQPASPYLPGRALKFGLFGAGALVLVGLALLLYFNPFGGSDADAPHSDTPNPALAGNVPDLPADAQGDKDYSSLLHGAGDLESDPDQAVEVGTGNGNQGQTVRPRMKRPRASSSGALRPDSRASSPYPYAIIAQPPTEADEAIVELDPFPLRELYAQTATQSEFYQLDPNTDHLIVCERGTLLHIPRHAFVDATSGESVTQTVQVEVKELYDRADYINSNFATVSNGQQLISAGTVYIDATSAGRRLRIAKQKDIYVEFQPRREAELLDMQLFHGTFNEKGESNLAPVDGRHLKMVPLPARELYFEEFWCDCGADNPWNQYLGQVVHPDFKDTWVATREFRQRVQVLRDMGYYVEGLKTYLDHTDKELWKVDQMVSRQLEDEGKSRKGQDAEAEYFNQFARQMLGKVESYEDYGLDLTRSDARKQLLLRDVSVAETERLIRLAKLRKQFQEVVESRLILAVNGKEKSFQGVRKGKFQKAGTELVAGYIVNHLGWNTVSKVANNEFGNKRREIKVRLTGNISYKSTRAYLVFNHQNSVLQGKPTTSQLHRFAKVPENVDGWIVVVGFEHAMPYLGMLRLPKDEGDRIATVTMEQTRFDAYLSALHTLN